MTVVSQSRRERKKAETRQRILAAAIGVFSAKGIEGTTVEEIASKADAGKGTIYNYFKTKEEMVVAFMVDLESKVQPEVARLINRPGNLASILTAFLRHHFRLKQPHHEFVRVLLAQMYTRGREFYPWIVEMQKAIDPPLESLFCGLQKRGEGGSTGRGVPPSMTI